MAFVFLLLVGIVIAEFHHRTKRGGRKHATDVLVFAALIFFLGSEAMQIANLQGLVAFAGVLSIITVGGVIWQRRKAQKRQ